MTRLLGRLEQLLPHRGSVPTRGVSTDKLQVPDALAEATAAVEEIPAATTPDTADTNTNRRRIIW